MADEIRLIGFRPDGTREKVDTAETLEEATKLAKFYLTDPKDNWLKIQFWDVQCRGWLTREQAMRSTAGRKPVGRPSESPAAALETPA